MPQVYRILEYNQGTIYEIAFVATKESTRFYLESSNLHNIDPDIFYFAQKISIEN